MSQILPMIKLSRRKVKLLVWGRRSSRNALHSLASGAQSSGCSPTTAVPPRYRRRIYKRMQIFENVDASVSVGFSLPDHPFNCCLWRDGVVLGGSAGLTILHNAVSYSPDKYSSLWFCLSYCRNCLLTPLFLGCHEVDQRILSLD